MKRRVQPDYVMAREETGGRGRTDLVMKAAGTPLVNNGKRPLDFGEADLIDPPRREGSCLPEKAGLHCQTVIAGPCGTGWGPIACEEN
jgi:hypothetical protein